MLLQGASAVWVQANPPSCAPPTRENGGVVVDAELQPAQIRSVVSSSPLNVVPVCARKVVGILTPD